MREARRAALTMAVAALLSSAFGHVSSLSGASKLLGTNSAAVSRCDTDGVSIVQNLSGSNVVGVTIGQIASACGGASLSVNVNNGTANSSGSGTVPAGGGSLTVSLAGGVAAKDSEEIDVSISGP